MNPPTTDYRKHVVKADLLKGTVAHELCSYKDNRLDVQSRVVVHLCFQITYPTWQSRLVLEYMIVNSLNNANKRISSC